VTDTIFALSSGALPAAIAILRVSGPAADEAVQALAGSLPEPRKLTLRTLRGPDGGVIDDALVVRFAAPHTVTGESLAEFHCHGSRAVVARLLETLGAMPGLRHADPGEFTRRALCKGRLDLTEAEGLGDLLAAETEWQRRAALDHAEGGLRRQVEGWRQRLLLLSAEAEAAIDYVDEEETEPDFKALVDAAVALRSEWRAALALPRSELLNDGLRVVLGGPPNSGKSSLFNALIGSEKAIVTAIPGTTRDLVEARLDLDGIPLLLIDTAGLRDSDDPVEQIGIERARVAQARADLLLWLGDPTDAPNDVTILNVFARADQRTEMVPPESIATSVLDGRGLDRLRGRIIEIASSLLPPPDRLALNARQAASLADAAERLDGAEQADLLLCAEALRGALAALDRLTGRKATEEVLDTLFARFCLGK